MLLRERSRARQEDLTRKHKERVEDESIALKNQRQIIRRQEQQIVRQEEYTEKLNMSLRRVHDMLSEKREELAELRGRFELLHSYAQRAEKLLQERGVPFDGLPDMPIGFKEQDSALAEVDFIQREIDQSGIIVKSLRPPSPPPPSEKSSDDVKPLEG